MYYGRTETPEKKKEKNLQGNEIISNLRII